jgi:hypothetical protein
MDQCAEVKPAISTGTLEEITISKVLWATSKQQKYRLVLKIIDGPSDGLSGMILYNQAGHWNIELPTISINNVDELRLVDECPLSLGY